MTPLLIAAFSQGLVGIVHCPVMCGPFAAISQSKGGFAGTVSYHIARLTGYAMLGGVSGLLGNVINTTLLAQGAALVGGAIILIYAASILFQFSLPGFLHGPAHVFLPLVRRANSSAIALGLCSSVLPCGMLFPAYALAITSGTYLGGMLVMTVFALGTMPAFMMLAMLHKPLQSLFTNPNLRRVAPAILLIASLGIIVYRTVTAEVICVHPQ
ncbi:MAG: sulfite exporter TauE/SafE family protein [Leptospirales bacterium]|nr:sulfite exporter TauE/SafE family protein [Leptospirales bacterium]